MINVTVNSKAALQNESRYLLLNNMRCNTDDTSTYSNNLNKDWTLYTYYASIEYLINRETMQIPMPLCKEYVVMWNEKGNLR